MMTDNHTDARKALADIVAIECSMGNVFKSYIVGGFQDAACDLPTMRAIADLVAAQDAQIAALHHAALALLESDENTGGNAGQMFFDALDKALLDTKQAAKAFEARIRADEREKIVALSKAHEWLRRALLNAHDVLCHYASKDACADEATRKINDALDVCDALESAEIAIRAMGGKGNE